MKVLIWWNERQPRERYLLAGALAVLVMLVLYLLIEPVINERARMRDELPQLEADLAWMQDHTSELRTLMTGPGNGGEPAGTGPSLAVVQTILNELALQASVSGLKPLPDSAVQLEFDSIRYPALVDLMYSLQQRTGGSIQSAEISLLENTPGTVRAAFILGR